MKALRWLTIATALTCSTIAFGQSFAILGPVASGYKQIVSGKIAAISTSSTFGNLNGLANVAASRLTVEQNTALGGTFRKLNVIVTPAPATGQQVVFTVEVNASATSLTCTVSGTGTTCTDATDSAAITAGQLFDVAIAPSGSSATTTAYVSVEFDTSGT